ncbi:MAG: DUF4038 domain-containing protein [Caldilineaceae bacterium]|nr:DUF4038 domain-containing protein [Caldilineaceae bacterium]
MFTCCCAGSLSAVSWPARSKDDGLLPFQDADPARPNRDYFAWIDEVVRLAADYGLYVGLLPT